MPTMTDAEDRHATRSSEAGRTIHVFGKAIRLPRSRALRIAIGIVLVILGMFGFLPILGFWMIPLGLLVLSYEFATVRRWRRRLEVSWGRWRNGRA
jgi:purine-cytosine permease-like protein